MQTVLERVAEGARVAVVRLRSLGDSVLTTPALAILRQSRPDLRIAVVVESRFAPVFQGNPGVEVLEPSLAALRAWQPDLCVDFHGGNRSAALTLLSGARFRAGFGHFRLAPLYNLRIPRAQEILGEERVVHTAEHMASAMFWLGAQRMEIPRCCLFADRVAVPLANASPYAVIHPAASHPAKTWPARRFLDVAHHLRDEYDLTTVFVAGPGEDLAEFRAHRTVSGAPLEEVKALLAGASLFVGNDSGPAHMAAAFGLPVVVIFGTSNVAIWRPWKTACQVLDGRGDIASITTQQVLEALARLRVHA